MYLIGVIKEEDKSNESKAKANIQHLTVKPIKKVEKMDIKIMRKLN